MSDGSSAGTIDKCDDLGLPTAWKALADPRNVVVFGDGFATSTSGASVAGATHVARDAIHGMTVFPNAAGVPHDRLVRSDRKVDLTFLFGLSAENGDGTPPDRPGPGSARSRRLAEVFDLFDVAYAPGAATATPATRTASLSLAPNPFNPVTVVRFAPPRGGVRARVRVFDLRGSAVASGVYFVKEGPTASPGPRRRFW